MIKYIAFVMTLNITAAEWWNEPTDPPIQGTIRRQDSRVTYIPDPHPIRRPWGHVYKESDTDIDADIDSPPIVRDEEVCGTTVRPGFWSWIFGCWRRDND